MVNVAVQSLGPGLGRFFPAVNHSGGLAAGFFARGAGSGAVRRRAGSGGVKSAGFSPSGRSAIFVNGKDLDVERYNGSSNFMKGSYSPVDMLPRGNRMMYELEAAITARTTIPEDVVSRFGAAALEPILEGILDWTGHIRNAAMENRSEDLRGTVLRRIHPLMDMREALAEEAGRISQVADETHLTSVFIYAHGSGDGFEIGRGEFMPYLGLLELLDAIPGRKFVLASSCYSGVLLDILKGHPAGSCYSCITSTRGELGTNWNDDVFHKQIIEMIAGGRPISELSLSTIDSGALESQTPSRLLNFDVVI